MWINIHFGVISIGIDITASLVDPIDLVFSPVDFSLFFPVSSESVLLASGCSSFGGEPISTVFISILELVVSSAAAFGLGFWLSANGVPSSFLALVTSLRIEDFFAGLVLASLSSLALVLSSAA